MIKLAITDLDGTLLTPERTLPENTFDIIRSLNDKGIVFGAASGRQLQNLKELFAPVAENMVFIAENGGLGWYGGKLLFCNALPAEDAKRALDAVRSREGLFPLLCAPECAYYENRERTFVSYVQASYNNNSPADLDNIVKRFPICKIAVYDMLGAEKNGMRQLPPLLSNLRVIQSGMDWIDVSLPCANKGAALEIILRKLSIDPGDCMAFGDHMNDYEMLQVCGHPRVTENAFYKLKELIPHIIPSNREYGVLRELQKLL